MDLPTVSKRSQRARHCVPEDRCALAPRGFRSYWRWSRVAGTGRPKAPDIVTGIERASIADNQLRHQIADIVQLF
jgi:hypothetical protein